MKFKITDYINDYGKVMDFNKNKSVYMHQWYPFVEGYSEQFINSILDEQESIPKVCLDPFSGSGTTSLELQRRKIKCYSFEVNPFLHLLSKVKLETRYCYTEFSEIVSKLTDELSIAINSDIDFPLKSKKFIVNDGVCKKWNYSKEVYSILLIIKNTIDKIEDKKYRELLTISLASIVLPVSNLYRNGKCLSYKKNWEEKSLTRQEVLDMFLSNIKEKILPDVLKLNRYDDTELFSNRSNCFFGDVRIKLDDKVDDNSIDLVITSPPYLNSRDYTDIYMLELWVLGFVNSYEDVRSLRKSTLRSHVQVKWQDTIAPQNKKLHTVLKELETYSSSFWNNSIPDMISGYFDDIRHLFSILYRKLKPDGKIYFNVANSAYYGIVIKVDEICAELAEQEGFTCTEIRTARWLKTSGQQKDVVERLRESVVVLTK